MGVGDVEIQNGVVFIMIRAVGGGGGQGNYINSLGTCYKRKPLTRADAVK